MATRKASLTKSRTSGIPLHSFCSAIAIELLAQCFKQVIVLANNAPLLEARDLFMPVGWDESNQKCITVLGHRGRDDITLSDIGVLT
jgi:hypothetical protein